MEDRQEPTADAQRDRRGRLNQRLRQAFIEGAEGDSRRRLGRGLTAEERLAARGVRFTQQAAEMGPVTTAVFDDTCGNRIQIARQR